MPTEHTSAVRIDHNSPFDGLRGVTFSTASPRLVLGSRSPRRRELLARLVPADCIDVIPPVDPTEDLRDSFDDRDDLINALMAVVTHKRRQVAAQITGAADAGSAVGAAAWILCADTTVVVSGRQHEDSPQRWELRGQPPPEGDWARVVERWFREDYFDRWHEVLTVAQLAVPDNRVFTTCVTTRVFMSSQHQEWLPWYLRSQESLGKAGGYALQGAGSLFVSQVEGSLTNVIGLPLAETATLLAAGGWSFQHG